MNIEDNYEDVYEGLYKVRTDLALEINENVRKEDTIYSGIIVKEKESEDFNIKVTALEITNSKGEKLIGKEKGNYITIEAAHLDEYDEAYNEAVINILSQQLEMLMKNLNLGIKLSILVVGLGNREVTADSLGPKVVDNLIINRHKNDEEDIQICAISPGVMAQTGMETADIIMGIATRVKPSLVIAIDALAARNTQRLNTTIQISDTGINPGSGVGNHRVGITKKSVGVPVIAIGVPTVIDASTIVCDAIAKLDVFKEYSGEDKRKLISKNMLSEMQNMYVTPKDIDANVNIIGETIALAINKIAGS